MTTARPRSASVGRPKVGSGLASALEPKVRSYHDHRATALRFCWSTQGRKRSGFHACSGSPEQSGASGATKTTARPRSASAGRAVVGSWSRFHLRSESLHSLHSPHSASDHRTTALRFCGHTCGRKRSGFQRKTRNLILTLLPTTARPRSASAGRSVVGSGLASTFEPKVRTVRSYHDHRATSVALLLVERNTGRWSTATHFQPTWHVPCQVDVASDHRATSVALLLVERNTGRWSTATHFQPTWHASCQVDFASDHRATALRFCWSTPTLDAGLPPHTSVCST
jgi:hypothetical protein